MVAVIGRIIRMPIIILMIFLIIGRLVVLPTDSVVITPMLLEQRQDRAQVAHLFLGTLAMLYHPIHGSHHSGSYLREEPNQRKEPASLEEAKSEQVEVESMKEPRSFSLSREAGGFAA